MCGKLETRGPRVRRHRPVDVRAGLKQQVNEFQVPKLNSGLQGGTRAELVGSIGVHTARWWTTDTRKGIDVRAPLKQKLNHAHLFEHDGELKDRGGFGAPSFVDVSGVVE